LLVCIQPYSMQNEPKKNKSGAVRVQDDCRLPIFSSASQFLIKFAFKFKVCVI
jgi:hypothetical protein